MRAIFGLVIGLLFSASAVLEAQVTAGTILGTVTDKSGAAISGAHVTVKEVNKGTSSDYTTDSAGSYTAPFLVPGKYTVGVEMSGFKRETTDTQLEVDQKLRLDFTLEIGQLNETVTVQGSAPLIRSETAELGEVVNQQAVSSLPLNGRNFAQLVYLVPGVTSGQAGENLSGASTFNPRAGSNFNALGSQANANAWLVDGIMDNEYTFNTVMVQPSVESVQEFKVLTGTYSAEFGRGAGVVTTQTRSGSNDFHGSAFEFLRNSYMDARNYFNTAGSQKQPPYRRNQFGASLGGPILKNRTFFFADYYGWKEVKGQTFLNTVPTAQDRTGDFGDLPIKIYDPTSTVPNPNGNPIRTQFPNNRIPTAQLNQIGLNIASLYPLPNIPGALINNRVDTLSRNLDDNGGNLRIDHRFSDKDSLFGRFSLEKFTLFDTRGQGGCCLPTPASAAAKFDLGPYVAGGQNTTLTASGLAVNETHIFSPTLVNEFIAGYARTNPLTLQSDYGHNSATSLGIQGVNISQFATGLPTINVSANLQGTSYTALNGGPAFLPANPRQISYQAQDTLSIIQGNHNVKVGYRVVKDFLSPFTNSNTRSVLNFGTNLTNNPATNDGGSGLASLLLGYMANGTSADASRGYLREPYYLTVWEHALYAQDDWKVSKRLTLNLGLRWDLFSPYREKANRLTNFDLSTLTLVYAGVNGIGRSAGLKTRFNDFGPHFGFAYDVLGNGKTVVRGGYEMSYFPEQASGSNFLGLTPPWAITQNTPTVEQYPLTLAGVPSLSNPFGPPTPVQPFTTAQLIAANPSILGTSFANQTPSYQTWTLNIERQIGRSMLAEVAYAGSHGLHLLYGYNPQEVEPGTGSSNSRVLIPAIASVRSILQIDPRNSSNYHGLQAKLTQRFSNGLQFLASYTYSKTLDFGGSVASGGGASGGPQTVTNLRAGYGPSGFDIRHRFVGSFTYELPFGPGKKYLNNGIVSHVFGGWELGGILTLQSGLPFSVNGLSGACPNNASTCWPDRIASGKASNQDYSHWYDPSAFVVPCAVANNPNGSCSQPAYRFGTAGRGILNAPGTYNMDAYGAKNITVRERLKVQLRLEAFNAFNHPQLGFPNQTINIQNPASTSTAITSTIGDNRDLEAAIKINF